MKKRGKKLWIWIFVPKNERFIEIYTHWFSIRFWIFAPKIVKIFNYFQFENSVFVQNHNFWRGNWINSQKSWLFSLKFRILNFPEIWTFERFFQTLWACFHRIICSKGCRARGHHHRDLIMTHKALAVHMCVCLRIIDKCRLLSCSAVATAVAPTSGLSLINHKSLGFFKNQRLRIKVN